MKIVYLLEHYYESEGHEETRYIGVFSNKKKATEVIKKLKSKPGFNKFPDGFYISKIFLDQSSWDEGFIYFDSEDEYGNQIDN